MDANQRIVDIRINSMSQTINNKLQASRKELLDIGLKNNLISFKKNSKNLTIVFNNAASIFSEIFIDEKALSFSAAAKSLRIGMDESISVRDEIEFQDPEILNELSKFGSGSENAGEKTGKARRSSAHPQLHTALDEERLFLQLLKIRAEAQTYVEEQGVNILFLALGFLHWHESDSSSEARRAPLVLVPVTLNRATAQDQFKVSYTGDDLIFNLSLSAKLKTDFGIQLPQVNEEAEFDAIALSRYFEDVKTATKNQKRWSVQADEMVLGFFSFGKFLMFKDLDPQSWPADKSPAVHQVMGRLLGSGFGDKHPAYADDVNVDSVCSPGEVHFVKDADSSQTQAILEVRAGSNLVIQGPPGTGKSQTITNLIAELISQGKTVLFVSEKMAALEVVKRRLDECHLGDAVLELHSQRATKTSVLTELARSLDQGKPLNDQGERDIENLQLVQESLNSYCDAVSAAVGQSGLPFLDVLGRYMKCVREWSTLSPLDFKQMAAWTDATFSRKRDLLKELERQVTAMGRPDQSPYWGSTLVYLTPIAENAAASALQESLNQLSKLQTGAESLSQRLMLSQPATLEDITVVCRAARRAEQAPKLAGVQLSTQDWQVRRDTLRTLIDAGRHMTAVHQAYASQLLEVAWEQDLLPVRQALLSHGRKWWRFMSGEFKNSRRHLQSLAKEALPKASGDMLKMVDAVIAYQQHRKVYNQHTVLGAALFGVQWQDEKSDWAVLDRITTWVVNLHDDLGKGTIPKGIVDFLSGNADASGLGLLVTDIDTCTASLQVSLGKGTAALGLEGEFDGANLYEIPLDELEEQLVLWNARLPDLYHMARFNALAEKLDKEELDDFVDLAARCDQPEFITASLDLTWYSGLIQSVYEKNRTLQQFDRIQHEFKIQRFRELDLVSLKHAQTKLAAQVWDAKPGINQPGEMAVLRGEINKKRRHLPIRQLMHQAGRAIQQIKPVFMMSPMSIANFLPPGKIEFDVVIFDEASQVKAVDAFGAILRAKQVVVVGDTRQMPPTDFFGREVDVDDEDNTTSDIESILSMFKAAGCRECYLRWHYRSRHESLIAVSNAEFYDNKLVIFPSAGSNPQATGIRLDHLPDALYDRGRTRTNKEEAKAVAIAVIEHALSQPGLSLGVAAFSVAQRDLIIVEVELLRRKTPEAEPYFNTHTSEPFFVKNLENIQGDERDAIFISIGYGRNESGKIAKEFGPLNKDGGHRRLNVLITRAKMVMRVFCNFKAEDLELDATAKHGVRALKNFLKFAETRRLEVAHETGKDVDSPFEAEVIQALRELGYNIEPQVGTSGYFIDMAVRDSERPGRYLLAIECDGAAYHSSRSARDRDRLRQGVLEGLGWTFHRIWSTDWFRNRQHEVNRVVTAIKVAKLAADQEQPPTSTIPTLMEHHITRGEPVGTDEIRFAKLYVKVQLPAVNDLQLHQTSPQQIGAMINRVVESEGPIHVEEVTRRLMDAYGVVRAGSRITSSIQDAVSDGKARRLFSVRGEFLYAGNETKITVRDRSAFISADRKIEWVAPEELDAALLESIRLGFTLSFNDAVTSAIGMLGFGRATQKISSAVDTRLNYLIKNKVATSVNDMVMLPSAP